MASSNTFTLTDTINSVFPVIGFIKGNTYTASFFNSTYTLLSPYPCNFAGPTRLSVRSNAFTDLKNIDSLTNSINNTLCVVPCNATQNGIIFYENITQYKNIFTNNTISSIDIIITDDSNNFINFNNINWSLTLQIDVHYEKIHDYNNIDDIYEMEKQNFN
jgi:hypothetical protein